MLLADHLLSFSESNTDETFLRNLTHSRWASTNYHDSSEMLCFADLGIVHTINPYWAVNFDTSLGCDTRRQGELPLVDARCVTPPHQTCEQRFPEFATVLGLLDDGRSSDVMSEQCVQKSGTLSTARRGTFLSGYTEL